MLEVNRLTKNFGGLTAVNNVDMSIKAGDLLGLIGPNGAGKTTFFNLVTGFIKPSSGKVIFENHNITNKSPHYIASKGIVRTFQASNIFPDFTVMENIILSFHLRPKINFFETVMYTKGSRKKEQEILRDSKEILDLVGMEKMANLPAGSLAHGYKRLLGIAIALAARPKLLLLDEPLSGMNAKEVDDTILIIDRLWKRGMTILLIEHNMRAAMSLCKRIIVLNFGRKIAEGTPDEIKVNSEVIQAYLGAGEHVT